MVDAICEREVRATRLADCLLAFVPSISAIVCKQCHYAVPADMLRTQLSAKEVHGFKLQLVRDMIEEVKRRYPRVASSTDDLFAKSFRPHPSIQPLPYLTVHSNCYGCGFEKSSNKLSKGKSIPDDAFCQFFAGSKKGMFEHYRKAHKWVNPRRRGRPCGKIQGAHNSPDGPWRTGFTCQRLRLGPRASHLFQVAAQIPCQGHSEPVSTAQKRKAKRSSCSEIEESMLARLQEAEAQITEMQSDCALNHDQEIPRSYQRSPWLDLTRWPNYLSGIRLASVRALLILPERSHEYGHHALAGAEYDDVHIDAIISKALDLLDKLIEEARVVLTKDRLNVFDQHRLNSFYRGKSFRRPIFTKLMDGTYRKYKAIWKQLLCYVIRVCYFRRGPDIHFSMTRMQILSLERLMHLVRTSIDGHNTAAHKTRSARDVEAASNDEEALRACLDLCIALLDHELKGNIYDSIVVGFLAAIGIDARNECFREAPNYSSSLSGLIKMAQFFVALRSIRGMDEGEADFASDLLDEMQDKFMVSGSRSPVERALKLRAYCRAVRDTTTVYGSIVRSADGQTVSFRDVGLHLPSFRWHLRDHLIAAQNTLAKLLLVSLSLLSSGKGYCHPGKSVH